MTIAQAGHDQHEDEGGGHRPGHGDHAGGDVDQSEKQVTDDRPGGAAAEHLKRLHARGHEGEDREDDHEGKDGDPGQARARPPTTSACRPPRMKEVLSDLSMTTVPFVRRAWVWRVDGAVSDLRTHHNCD